MSTAVRHPTAARLTTGLTRLVREPDMVERVPTAMCSNYTSVTDDLQRGVDAVRAVGVDVRCILAPEHGYWGSVQAGEDVGDDVDERSGLRVLDTYKVSGRNLDQLVNGTGVRQILFDLQDIGTRFYTYTWTLFDLLCTAARTGVRIVVLDRPNPLGGQMRLGPGLLPEYSSFVGRVSIPLQHGLSMGELARWFNAVYVPEQVGATANLEVIAMSHWDRSAAQAQEMPWVLPSPNMPTVTTAMVYPATGLLEGTVLSEGRGTTRPFEVFGAPWLDPDTAAALNDADLPGVRFREHVFRPMFSKGAGQVLRGVQLHLLDTNVFDPIRTGITILSTLQAMHPRQDLWHRAEPQRPAFIDLLWGNEALRTGVDDRASAEQIITASAPTPHVPADVLLYS